MIDPDELNLELTRREHTHPGIEIDLQLHPAEPPPPAPPVTPPVAPPVAPPAPDAAGPAAEVPFAEVVEDPAQAPTGAMPAVGKPTMPMPFETPLPIPKPAPVKQPQPSTGAYVVRKPEWKVLEPEDRNDPVPHERVEEHPLPNSRRLIAVSVRGKLHAHKGDYREDAFAWAATGNWTTIAVADGAGSASLARVGSALAVERLIESLRQRLGGLALTPPADDSVKQPPDAELQAIRTALADAAEDARQRLLEEATRRNVGLRELSTTLLAVAHTEWAGRELVACLRVGDGAIALWTPEGVRLLGFADQGEYASETRFLTSGGIEQELRNRVVFSLPPRVTALAVMTDGVSDDFFPERERLRELFDGNPIVGMTTPDEQPLFGLFTPRQGPLTAAGVREWLRYERRASSDDRTLVLLVRGDG